MSDKVIKEYILLIEFNSATLERKVNDYIKQGYQPYGAPFISRGQNISQAVVLYGFESNEED